MSVATRRCDQDGTTVLAQVPVIFDPAEIAPWVLLLLTKHTGLTCSRARCPPPPFAGVTNHRLLSTAQLFSFD